VPSPGECDADAEALAYEVVYTADGIPAYAGQALLNRSCGNGQFCHTEGLVAATDRHGAPGGLDFDLPIAALVTERTLETRAAAQARADRLFAHQQRVRSSRDAIWGEVTSGRMPPGGAVGGEVACRVGESAGYDRVAADGATFTSLPRLVDTPDPEPGACDVPARPTDAERAEAREILRSWLACGAPIIDRTIENALESPVGQFVPVCERSCVDATWDAIYEQVIAGRPAIDGVQEAIRPSCAIAGCHAPDPDRAGSFSGMLDMSGGAAAARLALVGMPAVGAPAMGEGCSGPPPAGGAEPGHGMARVVPGDASASLLFLKISAASSLDVCGGRMPSGTIALSPQRACAIAAWIDCGAHADGSCDDPDMTLEEHRAACNIPPGGGTEACLVQEPCVGVARP
jgi:hypothetical protein